MAKSIARWSAVAFLGVGGVFAYQGFSEWYGSPDVPYQLMEGMKLDRETFMSKRAEHFARLRGWSEDSADIPQLRQAAVAEMTALEAARGTSLGSWSALGPDPIPNGQTVGTVTPVSGRTISIAVHPTNSELVYVGTANGGLYRSSDGGANWRPLMDGALSLAIGAVAIAPSQPDTIYVGTGEPNFSLDSFFGVGVYRIDNASSANPTVVGPLNRDAGNVDVFSGRSVSEIMVHPTNPNIIICLDLIGRGRLWRAVSGGASYRCLSLK
jgi:hypothetical protein